MFFKRFYDTDLAQASYLVGCQKTGEGLVIDPVRDIQQYQAAALDEHLRVTHVTETHIHADYLSGSRELCAATGAQLYLSDEGGPEWRYGFAAHKVKHASAFWVGNLKIEVRHTPGHTPESISLLVTDTPRGAQPVMYFTGDFVFVGEVGRPDLLDEAAGGVDTRFVGAQHLFNSLREQFLNLPDFVQVWPGHGSGSACGKALGAVPSTTVGYERALAWWADYVQRGDLDGFSAQLLSGQPDAPLYYSRMKQQNKRGPALLGQVAELPQLGPEELKQHLASGAKIIDTRPRSQHQAAAPHGAIHLPSGNTLETWAGWLLRPEDGDYILLAAPEEAQALRRRLWMVGLDNVVGFIDSAKGLTTEPAPLIDSAQLPAHALILDVRSKTEYNAGHIPGAQQLHAGRLAWAYTQLPQDRPVVVHCQSGARSAAASSFLRAKGFKVLELAGGYAAWAAAQTPPVQQALAGA